MTLLVDGASCMIYISYGVRGRLLRCIHSFLSDRTFQVQLGTTMSDTFIEENGVPQGGVLSVTLFAVKINSLSKIILLSLSYSLYVDDVQILYSSCSMPRCERQLQLTINRLSKWADENAFRFSPDKTVCVLFSLRRGLGLDPILHSNRCNVIVKRQHKLLCLIFDSKLTFITHLIRKKCLKSANILKVISHKTGGSDRLCLFQIYNSLIRSRLDYGSIVYGSARPSALKMLDPVHHLNLPLATGAFRISPVPSLYAETYQMSLEKRGQFLSISYAQKLLASPTHPAYPCIRKCPLSRLFESKPRVVRPLSLRVEASSVSFPFKQEKAYLF